MKSIPQALRDHLNSDITTLCYCCQLTRKDGTEIGFTDHDSDLHFDGVRFIASAGVEIGETAAAASGSIDNTDIIGALDSDALTTSDIDAGHYDDAGFKLYLVNWSEPTQRLLLRKGSMGRITRDEDRYRVEVRGLAATLATPQGRLFQRKCDAALGDSACGVDLSVTRYTTSNSVTRVNRLSEFNMPLLSGFTTDWFNGGVVKWQSGGNKGTASIIRKQATISGNTQITLAHPPINDIQLGDRFSLTVGCDKTIATCHKKFSNHRNFRGFPYIPGDDFIYSYPNREDSTNDGSSLFRRSS